MPDNKQTTTHATARQLNIIAANRVLYAIEHWADGYFDIAPTGHLVASPTAGSVTVDLRLVVAAAREKGLKTPLLVRFPDIIRHRRDRLIAAFNKAITTHDYNGQYQLVYPIKVNQHRQVVTGLLKNSSGQCGLEAGSKPELMIALAYGQGKTVICNGYKDRHFIRLALLGRLLEVNTVIVVEKPRDLQLVLEESEKMNVEPVLGVRMRLSTITSGQWQNSGGHKAKFGLMPGQLLYFLNTLKQHDKGHWLKLLHFHMGSQVANLEDITRAVSEISRYYTAIHAQGFHPDTLDIGGGLAVDYEGARSRDTFSMNYDLDEYAHAIVNQVAEQCRLNNVPQPHIVSESGRALVAHHSVLITDISDSENPLQKPATKPSRWHHLCEAMHTLQTQDKRPPSERYFQAQGLHEKGLRAFSEGKMDLANRAWLDYLVFDLYRQLLTELHTTSPVDQEIHQNISETLAHKYFANFSVFESIPDVWGINQVFPIVPLTRLNEEPLNNAIIHDLTCDSDGQIKRYVTYPHLQHWLPLHPPKVNNLVGIFLTGAYQEILGDIHNLFGDTHSIVVEVENGQWHITESRRGDSTDQLLDYVGYNVSAIELNLNDRLSATGLDTAQTDTWRRYIHQELHGYTYLDH